MKKYLVIIFILALLFISGCDISKTGEAERMPIISIPSVSVRRDLSCGGTSTVNLDISNSGLDNNEIIVIADKIPYGTSIVDGSWSHTPAYILDDKLVWLFAKNPPQTTEDGILVTESIPHRVSYQFSGSSSSEFRGKWSLEKADKDGLIIGEGSC